MKDSTTRSGGEQRGAPGTRALAATSGTLPARACVSAFPNDETSSESPVHGASVSQGEDDEDLVLPVHVEDQPVVPDAQAVCVHGPEFRQVASRIDGNRPKPCRDPTADRRIELPELGRGQDGELDPERQGYPSGANRSRGTVRPARTWRRASKISSTVFTSSSSSRARASA